MEIPHAVKPRPDTGLYNAKLGIWLFLASEVMLFGGLFSAYILLRVSSDLWPHGMVSIPVGTFNTFVLIASSVTVVMSWASLKLGKLADFKKYMALTILCALGFLSVKSFEYYAKFTHYDVWFKDQATAQKYFTAAYGEKGEEAARKLFVERFHLQNTKATYDANQVQIAGHIEGNPLFATLKKLTSAKKDTIQFTPDAPSGTHEHPKAIEVKLSDVHRLSAYVPAHSTYFAIYFTITALHGLHVLGGAIVLTYFLLTSDKWWKKNPEQLANRVEVGGLFWHFVDLVWIFLFPIIYLL
ncbi:MAG: heme-copper oxidase subunit III [Verrucomicrobia bacterium]|nr:heme-copper oxidase subunit III [Verrucomicrobiota bacterium]